MFASASMPGHLIRRLHQRSTQVFAHHVKTEGHDLTPVQFAVLDALGQNPGIDQAKLAEKVGKDAATIGAVVDRLENKRLLTRVRNPEDKRARVLKLTELGESTVSAVLPIVEKLQKEILFGLDEQEYRQFIHLAMKVAYGKDE